MIQQIFLTFTNSSFKNYRTKMRNFNTFGNKQFRDYLVKMIFYLKAKSSKMDVKMLYTILELFFFGKNAHFFSKK